MELFAVYVKAINVKEDDETYDTTTIRYKQLIYMKSTTI